MSEKITQLLVAAREAQSLSQEEIAKQTRLSLDMIKRIESADFDNLAPIYIRGYLRSYARVVNMPEAQLSEALASSPLLSVESAVMKPALDIMPAAPIAEHAFRKMNPRWLMYAGIGLTAVIALISWVSHSSDESASSKLVNAAIPSLTISTASLTTPSVQQSTTKNTATTATQATTAAVATPVISSPTIVATAAKPAEENTQQQKTQAKPVESVKQAEHKKKEKHVAHHNERFFVKPDAMLHTTYQIKAAT